MRNYPFPFAFLFLFLAAALAVMTRVYSATPEQHINSQLLRSALVKLSEYGRHTDGGVTRRGFSEADIAAREDVIGATKDAGVSVRIDPAGNIFGHFDGSENLAVILFGSHTDSVMHGVNYDSDVGSLGVIEGIRALTKGGTA